MKEYDEAKSVYEQRVRKEISAALGLSAAIDGVAELRRNLKVHDSNIKVVVSYGQNAYLASWSVE